jgi:hypothetical protein
VGIITFSLNEIISILSKLITIKKKEEEQEEQEE